MNRFFDGARVGALVLALGSLSLAGGAQAASTSRLDAWKQAIANTSVPAAGCFTADYPSAHWRRVSCTVGPLRPFMPRDGRASRTVGDGNDYAAVTAGITRSATGSFPSVTSLTKETNNGNTNEYSLQLNSNFASGSKTCSGAKTPKNCRAWQQFVLTEQGGADAEGILMMQYWLIGYDKTCPSRWVPSGGNCYINSGDAVAIPAQKISQLKNLQLSGKAVVGGLDTTTIVTSKKAYSVTGEDSVLGLAKLWNASEFNVIGDGDSSEAKFNKGTAMTVKIAVSDGSTKAPTCQAGGGTTAETNNLNLGKCKATGGAAPAIQFTQSK